MEGVVELAEEIFHMPVRLGAPQGVSGLVDIVNNPIYATGVGLLQYGVKQHQEGRTTNYGKETSNSWWDNVKEWFQGNF